MKHRAPGARGRLFFRACIFALLLALAFAAPSVAAEPIRLLNTVEFRSPLKDFPKWTRVVNHEKKTPTFTPDRVVTSKETWADLKARWSGLPYLEQLKAVNAYFNQWPYRLDIDNWGMPDYWATPEEFIKKSGDCEDYAITKYYALRALGVPAERLRILAVTNTLRGNEGHAVLAAYTDNDVLILDNISNLLLSHTRCGHYRLQASLNENYRWAHVPVKK